MEITQSGFEIHAAHFPGQAPIDAYGKGGFRFANMSHTGSLVCLPSGIYAWEQTDPENLTLDSFSKIFEEASDIEILLIGTGFELVPVKENLRDSFRKGNISADAMATGSAVRTYNVLVSEGRAVAAAFLAVE